MPTPLLNLLEAIIRRARRDAARDEAAAAWLRLVGGER